MYNMHIPRYIFDVIFKRGDLDMIQTFVCNNKPSGLLQQIHFNVPLSLLRK